MASELLLALNELEKEKGIDKEVIISAIEEALNTSYGKSETEITTRVEFDRENGDIKVYAQKEVVEEVEDDSTQLSLAEARSIDPEFDLGDIAEFEITPRNYGRLAAQKAKQIIIQKLREEERSNVYQQYAGKKDDLVTGKIQRIETKDNRDGTRERIIHVDLGRIEGIILPGEQVPGEQYKPNENIKAYVVDVHDKGFKSKDPCVMISRTHPNLVRRLFELEVPEILDGTVKIVSVAREAGSRTKIAVYSTDENVEPVGACVGTKGMRVNAIVDELKGERIDIIKYDPSPDSFIAASLSPAKVLRVFVDDASKSGTAIVQDNQLSLAIGREGQNVRLAAKLTGWKIDIKSESQIKEMASEEMFKENLSENMPIGEGNYEVNETINPFDENDVFDPDLV